jgi:CBS domain-containing membrane protein
MNRELVKIGEKQTMSDVAQEFRARDISSAPVIDDGGSCIGILSATDFLHRATLAASDSDTFIAGSDADVARSFMTREVLTVSQKTSVLGAAEIMTINHIHRLPVVDEHHQVVGVVSTMDVVAALLNAIEEWESL